MSTHLAPTPWRSIAVAIAAAGAIGEIASAFAIDSPFAALAFAALFAAALVWIRRGGRGGLIMLAALCAIELLFIPGYPRDTVADWLVQGAFAAGSITGLLA